MKKPEPKIRALPRPLRIAYVLEDGLDAHAWLDRIIAHSFSRHGGRQSLIVPYVDGTISQKYRDWLQVMDPDVVFLLTYQNQELAIELGTLLGDVVLEERERKHGVIEEYPRVGLEKPALTSLSWIPFLKTVSGFHRQPIDFILDAYPAWKDDGLIKDNFGTLHASMDGFPIHEQIAVRPLMLTPSNPPQNRWNFRVANREEIDDQYGLLEYLPHNGTVTLAQLSNMESQSFHINHPWNNAFCLVLGDALNDRISCWNAGLLFEDSKFQHFKTLRVPAIVADDSEKIARVGAFLRNANYIGTNQGPAKVVIRSSSIEEAQLADFIDGIKATSMSLVTFVPIASAEDCCPASNSDVSTFARRGQMLPSMHETPITESSTFVSPPAPHHLKYSNGQHPILSQGHWMVNLDIDKIDDHGPYCNIRQSWLLPKRRQLIKHFAKVDGARILDSATLAVPVDVNVSVIEVTQPSDQEIFNSLLVDATYHDYRDIRYKREVVPAYKYCQPSDKGRYLAGLLGLFGSLSDLEHTMNSRFWRCLFYEMAAPADAQRAEVIKFLQNRFAPNGKLLVESPEDWDRLAERIVQKARDLKVPRLKKRYQELLDLWEGELKEAIKFYQWEDREAEILAEAPNQLKSSLAYLIERRVFYRGHEWVCRNCSHRNWADIKTLDNQISCEVCATAHRLPVDLALDLRLNEFFATCLREHDTGTVACILAALRRQASAFFSFQSQTAIFKKYPEEQGGKPSCELDILCISDGKFMIGEAKARAEAIALSDIKALAMASRELDVDVAILAALTDERSVMATKLEQLSQLLPSTIQATSIVVAWDKEPTTSLGASFYRYLG